MRTLTLGMNGADVLALQQALAAQQLPVKTDGKFDWQTQSAVCTWQRRNGFPVDGNANLLMIEALGLGAATGASSPTLGNSGIVPQLPRRDGSRSLHIGLNRVDLASYGGWSGVLSGCENDARTMAAIARAEGFRTSLLLTASATSAAALSAVAEAARTLVSGETFLMTYSGHGGQLPNRNSSEDPELDQQDETWVLFERMLIDDELEAAFSAFKAGVNVLLLSDSCHSGTVYRAAGSSRLIPSEVLHQVLAEHGSTYRAIKEALGPEKRITARGVALNACQDNQLAQELGGAGVFTTKLKTLWANGTFRGSYAAFHKRLVSQMPPTQTPQIGLFGTGSEVLAARTPFKTEASRTTAVRTAWRRAA